MSSEDTNSFVRCYLLPNVKLAGRRKTEVVLNTLNPVWDEEFLYKAVYYDDLRTERVLELTVWDMDRRGTNSFMGCIRLGPNPLTVDNPQEVEWMDSSGDEVTHWEEMLANPGEWVERWHALRPSTLWKDLVKTKRQPPEGSTNEGLEVVHSNLNDCPEYPEEVRPDSNERLECIEEEQEDSNGYPECLEGVQADFNESKVFLMCI